MTRDTAQNLSTALLRANKYGETERAKKLLEQDYDGLSTIEALEKINKIIPTEDARVKEPADAMNFLAEKILDLKEFLDEHRLESFDEFHREFVKRDLNSLGFYLGKYLKEDGSIKKLQEQSK